MGAAAGATAGAAVPLSCISWAMVSTIAAMARGPPGLPSTPAQNEDHFAPVNHFCALTRLSSLRRQSRGCFHSESCSLICPRASSEALERMECFQGILGKFELSQMQCIQEYLPEVMP